MLPESVREAANGQLYVADYSASGKGAIIAVDPNSGQQSLVASGGNINGPVGVPAPGVVMLIVAVKLTFWPEVDGLTEELTVVLVLALLTVCPPARVALLAAKLLSPL